MSHEVSAWSHDRTTMLTNHSFSASHLRLWKENSLGVQWAQGGSKQICDRHSKSRTPEQKQRCKPEGIISDSAEGGLVRKGTHRVPKKEEKQDCTQPAGSSNSKLSGFCLAWFYSLLSPHFFRRKRDFHLCQMISNFTPLLPSVPLTEELMLQDSPGHQRTKALKIQRESQRYYSMCAKTPL